ncbi:hypothetical protein FHS95_003551 [Sphingomonas naasensis]|uniref:AcrB/AcrD/AcrF family protein n=1 Tax=Sphingomonas naasensis TaxID=1344951 RepID=A0A4V3QWG3_9SPHN|nr:hypothetical protein [Sphingomonas naasensis]NIJ21840.1 hypothetical protein [Sphingomonas naasensis]TGX42462.1 hypothetical protein E5A74_11525 [Sphingomonas naasensis]
MQQDEIATSPRADRALRTDALVALAIAALLTLCWAIADWNQLARLVLPDPDDMMRLAQVRDWLAGQGINDWTQYRLAPPVGAPMHWSRVNDLGPAAIIGALTPFIGRHAAELGAVLLYPALLFACAIFLTARIARRLWGAQAALVAAILAALAFPGTTLFVPGRIDHHGLQIVLMLAAVRALMRPADSTGGALAGLALALSLVIGLETAPQVAALIAVLFAFWVVGGLAERARLQGFAISLAAITSLFLVFLRPTLWSAGLCDAFTPASTTGTLAGSIALLALARATPRLPDWRWRLAIGGLAGVLVIGGTLAAFPACVTGPYGRMDPFLLREFMPHIVEANSVFALPFRQACSVAGLLLAGGAASVWMIARRPRSWATMLPIVAVIAVSLLVATAQVRGTYLGAPAAVPVLAGLVLAARGARRWRLPALVAAWLVSAGIAYHELPGAVLRLFDSPAPPVFASAALGDCLHGDVWQQIDRHPPGVTMAPATLSAHVIGATRMSTVGASYHRNNRGNMAMYRFFLGSPAQAAAIARAWQVRYVLFCPDDFAEMEVDRRFPHSVAAMLRAGRAPPGFERLPLEATALRFYRVQQ